MQIPTTLIRQARQDELPAVTAMYGQAGYKGTASPSDMVIVAVHDGRIIGAVRLCDEFGTTVLRGMYMLREFQRCGIGSELLRFAEASLTLCACYCIPYRHLETFYGLIGFKRIDESSAPRELRERCDWYRSEGADVILMERAAHARVPSN